MKKLSIFSLILGLALTTFGQSKTVSDFEENADGYKLFLYQSYIRLLNQDKNPDFNRLIQDLDHIRFVSTDSVGEGAKQTFKRLDSGIRGEGFEEVMSFDNPNYKCHVYELKSRSGKSNWVATLFMEGRAGLLEMKGSLKLKYLEALSSLNMDRLKEILPLEGTEQGPKRQEERKMEEETEKG